MSALALAAPSFVSFAGEDGGKHEGRKNPKNEHCQKIIEACKSAGFKQGGHKEEKGLWVDCFKPIMKDGKKIDNVTGYTDEDVAACKAAHTGKQHAKRHKHKGEHDDHSEAQGEHDAD